jgi:hypothetical protein
MWTQSLTEDLNKLLSYLHGLNVHTCITSDLNAYTVRPQVSIVFYEANAGCGRIVKKIHSKTKVPKKETTLYIPILTKCLKLGYRITVIITTTTTTTTTIIIYVNA